MSKIHLQQKSSPVTRVDVSRAEEDRMGISHTNAQTMVEILPPVEEFKHLVVFYTSEGRRKREVGADFAFQHRSYFIKTNQCWVLHLPVDPCSYPHLWSWAMSSDRKKRSRIQVSEMSFLRRMCGLSEIWWEAWSCRRRSDERRCIIRSQMRWGRYLVRPSLWGFLEDGLEKMLDKEKGPGRGKTQPSLFRLLPPWSRSPLAAAYGWMGQV